MMFSIALITFCILVIYVCIRFFGKRIIIPTGLKETPLEKGFPIFGIALWAKSPFCHYFKNLGKKHGSLFRIRLGMRDILILNDFQMIKKTFKEGGDNFSGRWSPRIFAMGCRNSGVLFTSGELWAEQRSFIIRVFRDFGLGTSRCLEMVQNECSSLLEALERYDGQSVDLSHFITIYVANITSKFVMNKRFSREDPTFRMIELLLVQSLRTKDYVQLFFLMFPALDQSDWFLKFLNMISSRAEEFDMIHDSFFDEIARHRNRLNYDLEGEDFMDRFLIMQNQLRENNGTVGTFTDWQLVRNSLEIFVAGYDTTSTVLGWFFMFLSKYPKIQARVHAEIIDKIGHERLPTMDDKKSLNYTLAVMDETLRLSSIVPLGILHTNLEDAAVDGYFIPKNTLIYANLLACHVDPDVWKKPLEFYPEHFLTPDEKGTWKYTPRKDLIAFGLGRRQCFGESFARMIIFIFVTGILQKYEVKFANEVSESEYQNCLHANEGSIRFSSIKDFIFLKRS